jgi:hypothetical protein
MMQLLVNQHTKKTLRWHSFSFFHLTVITIIIIIITNIILIIITAFVCFFLLIHPTSLAQATPHRYGAGPPRAPLAAPIDQPPPLRVRDVVVIPAAGAKRAVSLPA